MGAASQATGRSLLIWQIPEGNQYYDTVNNTNGHYQDNRAEYFFAHIPELQQAGIVGLLFGAGNAGSTTHTDAMKDGTTNPASICNSDGLSSGTVCNNHTSSYPDDDGGYLRLQAAAFYGGGAATPTAAPSPTRTPTPRPSATASPTATPTAPKPTATPTIVSEPSFTTSAAATPSSISRGGTVSAVASVTSATAMAALVDVEVYSPSGSKVYQKYFDNQAFATGQTRNYSVPWTVPTTAATGTYTVKIGVFSTGWGTLYSWNDNAARFSVH